MRPTFLTAIALSGALVSFIQAQPPERGPGPGGPGGFRPIPPIMAALDSDSDGELSASEIENASKALAKLDKNSDGKLTPEELRPNFPGPGRPGEGRPGEGRGGEGRRGEGRGEEGRGEEDRDRPGFGGFRPNPDELFTRLDLNQDGKLTKDEIPERMQDLVARADADKNEEVTKEELAAMFRNLGGPGGPRPGGPGIGFGFAPPNPEAFVERAMQFDEDKDEKLSKDELRKMASQMGRGFGGNRGEGGRPDGEREGDRPRRPE